MYKVYDLIPNQDQKSCPLFATDEEYGHFRDQYAAEIAPQLKEDDRRRAQSTLESMHHWVNERYT